MIGSTISHYKVIRKIGEGGMGVVYEAEDVTLKRTVALKFLPIHALDDPDQRARLIREAQAAAALDHINLNTVYEIGEADGQTFMAMAYVEGDTLRQKIKRGPLPVGEALSYAIQVAAGLRKAHSQGIVHRDIKPGNVLITPEGIVKLVDFGLAKLAGATGLTRTDSTLGTAAYMSPEQAKGDRVDHRCDIWSLGVILYEMLAGKLPFRGEHEAVVIYSILNEDYQPLRQVRPEVSEEIDAILARALAKKRDDRYAQVEEMLNDLRGLHHETPADVTGPVGTVRTTKPIEPLKPRRPLVMVAIVAALVVVFLGGLWYATLRPRSEGESATSGLWDPDDPYHPPLLVPPGYVDRTDEDAPMTLEGDSALLAAFDSLAADSMAADTAGGPPLIAVLYLENLGGNASEAYFAAGVTEDIIGDLSNLKGLRVLSRHHVLPYRGKNFDIRNIGTTLGVDYVLEGSIQRERDQLRVNTRLVRADDGTLEWNQRFDRAVSDIFAVQSEIASAVTEAMKVQLADDERERLERPPTTDIRAYEYYLKAREYLAKRSVEDNKNAEREFTRALERDKRFAEAMVGLAETNLQKIDWGFDIDPKYIAEAERLLNEARQIDPRSPDLYHAQSTLYRLTGRSARAIESAGELVRIKPNDAGTRYTLGICYSVDRQNERARAAFAECLKLDPDHADAYRWLGHIAFWSGQRKQAEKDYTRALQANPDAPHLRFTLGWFYMQVAWFGQAETEIEMARKLKPETPLYDAALGHLRLLQGKTDEAIVLLKRASDRAQIPGAFWNLGWAYRANGKDRDAQRAFERALKIDMAATAIDPTSAEPAYRALWARCLLGQESDPLTAIAGLDARDLKSPNQVTRPYYAAGIYATIGDQARANDQIQALLKKNVIAKEYLAADPAFTRMQNNTDFRNLVGLGPPN